MSWDAHLTDDRGHEEGWWNYTHNTNRMIADALAIALDDPDQRYVPVEEHPIFNAIGAPWWRQLDGLDGPNGAALLDTIIRQLEADPGRYREMNPDNGWGDYDGLLKVLTEMRNAVPEWPTKWSASG